METSHAEDEEVTLIIFPQQRRYIILVGRYEGEYHYHDGLLPVPEEFHPKLNRNGRPLRQFFKSDSVPEEAISLALSFS